MQIVLLRIKEIGVMAVWERKNYRRYPPLLKYTVGRKDPDALGRNIQLEEFGTRRQAIRWATQNKDG